MCPTVRMAEEVNVLKAIIYGLFTPFYTSALHFSLSTKASVIYVPKLRGESRQRGMIPVGFEWCVIGYCGQKSEYQDDGRV